MTGDRRSTRGGVAHRLARTATLALVAVGLDSSFAARGGAEPVTGTILTAKGDRITDQAVLSDLLVFDAWRERLAALDSHDPSPSLYHRTKALGWLEFARELYLADDRSGAPETALRHATDLIGRMEAGDANLGWTTPPVAGTHRLRPAHWELGERLYVDPGFRCIEVEVAKLEMELVRAEHARAHDDSCGAASHVQAADELADYVSSKVRGCRPEPPPPTAAEIRRQIELLPKFVHFALAKADVIPASAQVLDHIAAVLKTYPQIAVQIEGHADRRGSVSYNLDLSRRRAQSVRDYLARAGLDSTRLQASYAGKSRPRVSGDDIRAFARNRCVIFHYSATENVDVQTVPQEDDLQIEPEGAAPPLTERGPERGTAKRR